MSSDGFQLTDSGLVPSDWRVCTLGEISERVTVGIASAATHAYRDRGVTMFRNQNIKSAGLDTSDVLFIEPDFEHTFRSKRLKAGDILTARTGYPGISCVVPSGYDGAQSFTTLITRPRGNSVDSGYLCYYINSAQGQGYFQQTQIGGGQKNVNAASLRRMPIPMPPRMQEQQAIAGALSDADALIESLSLLLAKKRQLKQGAMQELLNGKRRLRGIHQSWRRHRLDEVADVRTGPFGSALHESDYVESGTPIITVEHLGEFGVVHANLPRVSDSDWKRLRSYALEAGDIVFSRVGSVDRNALIGEEEAGWLFSGRLLRLRPRGTAVSSPFLSHYFHSESFKERVRSVAVGQTMASLNTRILSGVEILLPSLAEQIEIASVLSDMDAELGILKDRLDKTCLLKQGMMQELLTGRIRLVPPTAAAGATA